MTTFTTMTSLGVFRTFLSSFIIGPLNWLLSCLRPLLNPFIGERSIATPMNPSSTTEMMSTTARRLRRRQWPQSTGSAGTSIASFPTPSSPDSPYKPAILDVIKLRHYLLKASDYTIPIQLIDEIVDYAEYWPHVSATKTHPLIARGATAHSDVLVIRTPPICSLATHNSHLDALGLPEPRLLRPARKVVFTIRSHDQGWSGEPRETRGTYKSSYTWFDAQIDKQFRPIPHNAPLSRVPWELSSTLFLEKWPGHRHQVDDAEAAAQAAASEDAGSATETRSEASIPQETAAEPSEEELRSQQQRERAENAESAEGVEGAGGPEGAEGADERTDARVFSHTYLQNHSYEVQYNVQARSQTKEHHFEWSWTDDTPAEGPGAEALAAVGRGKSTGDGRFVRELRLGDCVSLWAKARHPQWANHVEGAKLEIYFAV